jgi:hypothetical protein
METLTTGWLGGLLLTWALITVVWVVLVSYRAVLASREEDQMFLAKGEAHIAADQQALMGKLTRLAKPIWTLGILSGALILTTLGLWLWKVMQSTP